MGTLIIAVLLSIYICVDMGTELYNSFSITSIWSWLGVGFVVAVLLFIVSLYKVANKFEYYETLLRENGLI